MRIPSQGSFSTNGSQSAPVEVTAIAKLGGELRTLLNLAGIGSGGNLRRVAAFLHWAIAAIARTAVERRLWQQIGALGHQLPVS
ncbi:hypothetical protein IFO70_33705 [Phormidium tenue FACHB-886]|nr:hypothetical protein [Phormidium tenue FACHB-886]